jgi:hypothetical protein
MPTLHSEVVIEAPAELIWGIIVDVARYPEWNPFNVRATSPLEIGAPIRMRVRMMGGLFGKWPGGWFQSQVEYIRANVPGEKICWGADMAGGRIVAERCQWLERVDETQVRYINEDEIGGPLAPFVMRVFGSSMQVGFDAVAQALKVRAERMHRAAR